MECVEYAGTSDDFRVAFAKECDIAVSVDLSRGPVRTVAALSVPPRDAAEAVPTYSEVAAHFPGSVSRLHPGMAPYSSLA